MGRNALPKGHALRHRLSLRLNDADRAALKRRRAALIEAGVLEPTAELVDAVRFALRASFGEPIAAIAEEPEVEERRAKGAGAVVTLRLHANESADLPAGAVAVQLVGRASGGDVCLLHVHCLPEAELPDPRLGEYLPVREDQEIAVPRGAATLRVHSITMEKVDFSAPGLTRRDPVVRVRFLGAKKS